MLIKLTSKFCFFIPCFVLQSLVFSFQSHAEKVTIFIRDDVFYDYEKFVDGRDILSIKNFSGKTIRRDVVDMIIAQQALKIGGFKHTFEYIPGKLNFRNTKLLEEGKLLISFDSYWLSDAKKLVNDVHISLPLINKGEYIAGIYTNPNNKAVLEIKSLEDLAQFTAVSTPRWATDWKTLQALPLKDLIHEDEWLSQARMVNLGWIDFMLMAFHSTKDQSFTMNKIHLVPVKNIGIELKDSRHYVISKKHPLGAEAIKAINIGLQALRKEKHISRAYQQAGFFVDKNTIHILNK
ncbi:hypothetical protein [Thalassotalea sp. SU-HH00458]|uniref:hypothetical protein n=1 Tax=Thalassotalea sp. SU-HH00458 TaxID=3127657 RepID=UPI0033657E3C